MKRLLFLATAIGMSAVPGFGEDRTAAAREAAQVQMVVTVEARRGADVPSLTQDDFAPFQGKDKLPMTGAVPLQGADADLQLFILIDDAASWTLGSQLADLRRFINAQPVTTAIAIGYMREGTVQTAAKMTTDHSLAAKAVRLPSGISSSPWLSLSELIKYWPESPGRREVLMVTSGTDPLGDMGPVDNPYLDSAIADAQRAGIIVYGIYVPAEGHTGHSFWRLSWAQSHLGQMADETGGEAYMMGFGQPVSIAPYLADLTGRLSHQYRIAFLAKTEGKPGLTAIRLTTEVPNAEIVSANRVYVPAGASDHPAH